MWVHLLLYFSMQWECSLCGIGWRQVVELMFAIDGGDRLKGTSRLALVLELLQDMLLKV